MEAVLFSLTLISLFFLNGHCALASGLLFCLVLTLRAGNRAVVLPLDQIWYIESRNHTVEVWGAREAQTFWARLSQVEELLPPGHFCRCHNSFLVNLEHVAQVGRREVLLDDGRSVPVSRSYSESAQEQFVRYLNMK